MSDKISDPVEKDPKKRDCILLRKTPAIRPRKKTCFYDVVLLFLLQGKNAFFVIFNT